MPHNTAVQTIEKITSTVDSIEVTLDDETKHISYKPGTTLLQSIRQAGMDSPSSCEAGQCGTCIAVLKTGEVSMGKQTALSDADIADGLILACQANPLAGPIAIDFDDV